MHGAMDHFLTFVLIVIAGLVVAVLKVMSDNRRKPNE